VAAALAGGVGAAMRASASTGKEELYVAVPIEGRGVARISLPTESVDAVTGAARTDVVIAVLLALLGALAIAWLFSRQVSLPVVELRDVAQALTRGDLGRRPLLRAPGEVGELAVALRDLAEQLQSRLRALANDETLLRQLTESLNEGVLAVDASRQVVRMNDTARSLLGVRDALPFPVDHLPRDVTLREAIEDAFNGEATETVEFSAAGNTISATARPLGDGGAVLALFDLTRLRRLEAVRRDFVANVSHELRTPLTVVGGFAETLAAEDVPFGSRRQFAERILAHTRRMQRIVDDLLDLSRIESGGWVPNPTAVELKEVAADVIATARESATAKGVSLTAEIAADAARQVLANLVDNAVRHTPTGSVVVFSQRHERGVMVGVRDTGIGIAAEHLPRIFERFYRVDPGRSREQGGTGLGLAIVKHLVEAHGGRVSAESVVGRGTTITARFPHAAVT
jgi:two-component system phosphate regulon sensor histidine kinase PhoR